MNVVASKSPFPPTPQLSVFCQPLSLSIVKSKFEFRLIIPKTDIFYYEIKQIFYSISQNNHNGNQLSNNSHEGVKSVGEVIKNLDLL